MPTCGRPPSPFVFFSYSLSSFHFRHFALKLKLVAGLLDWPHCGEVATSADSYRVKERRVTEEGFGAFLPLIVVMREHLGMGIRLGSTPSPLTALYMSKCRPNIYH